MNAVAFCHPFVPPEWIAAHGLQPCWLPCRAGDETAAWNRRGVCPVAASRLEECREALPAEALVLTTTCDQLRYVAAVVQHEAKSPFFLMHVPRTWQTAGVRDYYREELQRLSRFIVNRGGTAPQGDVLAQTILRYDRARAAIRRQQGKTSAREFGQALAVVRGYLSEPALTEVETEEVLHHIVAKPPGELRLALVGGPLAESDYDLLAAIENDGGRFVLDATEAGERTLPAPVDRDRLQADPFEELVRIYFDGIADIFQRPNDRLFAWLRAEIAKRQVRGILLRRYVWCDHWHGELPRLRQELGLPVLDWDGIGNDSRSRAGDVSRIEAFLEMLR
jgi:benzoyl-CoA reductase/2-hydroxyglutaryl-CoA dehydratase subunit BcrC/BadD/HgdB